MGVNPDSRLYCPECGVIVDACECRPDVVTHFIEQEWETEGEKFRIHVSGDTSQVEVWVPDIRTWAKTNDQGLCPLVLGPHGDEDFNQVTGLPDDAAARKDIPIFSGCLMYFPDALAAVAELSRIGNDQHNPGEPLHWAREKSGDELNALTRHLLDAGTLDTDGVRHSTKIAWRALANLQKEIEGKLDPAGKG